MSNIEELILHPGESGHDEEHHLCCHGKLSLYLLIGEF